MYRHNLFSVDILIYIWCLHCEIQTINQNIWHQLSGNNRYLYAIHEPVQVIVNCQDEVINIFINKTGVITLGENCKTYIHNHIILGTNQKTNLKLRAKSHEVE